MNDHDPNRPTVESLRAYLAGNARAIQAIEQELREIEENFLRRKAQLSNELRQFKEIKTEALQALMAIKETPCD